MTERTRLISYLLYGLFSAILKKNTMKTREVIFHIRLRALRLSSSLILKKYLYASFSLSYWKYSCTLSIFSVVFVHAHIVLLTTQKSRWTAKKIQFIFTYKIKYAKVCTGIYGEKVLTNGEKISPPFWRKNTSSRPLLSRNLSQNTSFSIDIGYSWLRLSQHFKTCFKILRHFFWRKQQS